MAETATAWTGSAKQFIDILTLALTGQLHQAKLGELGNLRTGRIVTDRRGEVLQELKLITT